MKIKPFYIQIRFSTSTVRLLVEQISLALGFERFQVTAKNGTLIFESNRPVLRRKGLKHRRPDLKLVHGKLAHSTVEEDIREAILAHIEKMEGTK